MKTKKELPDVAGLLASVDGLVKQLVEASDAEGFSPSMGLALGGLRTAKTGLAGHLENVAKAEAAKKTEAAAKEPQAPVKN